MKIVQFTEFRANASSLLDEVEAGETLSIIRHGKVVAEIKAPELNPAKEYIPSWKRSDFEPLVLKDPSVSLSKMIVEERDSYYD